MSYMRMPYYIWSDGDRLHIWIRRQEDDITDWVMDCEGFVAGVAVPQDVFDGVALARVAEMDPDTLVKAIRAYLRAQSGNAGTLALAESVKQALAPFDQDERHEPA